jgi:hypothetical protein
METTIGVSDLRRALLADAQVEPARCVCQLIAGDRRVSCIYRPVGAGTYAFDSAEIETSVAAGGLAKSGSCVLWPWHVSLLESWLRALDPDAEVSLLYDSGRYSLEARSHHTALQLDLRPERAKQYSCRLQRDRASTPVDCLVRRLLEGSGASGDREGMQPTLFAGDAEGSTPRGSGFHQLPETRTELAAVIRALDSRVREGNGAWHIGHEAVERNPLLAHLMKKWHGFQCQLCGFAFETCYGYGYVEVHHLDHLADAGLDVSSNMLVVCANHHRMLHHAVVRKVRHTSVEVELEINDTLHRVPVGLACQD